MNLEQTIEFMNNLLVTKDEFNKLDKTIRDKIQNKNIKDEEEIFNSILDFNNKFKLNPNILSLFTTYLQLIEDDSFCKYLDLKKIEEIYLLNFAQNKNNLDILEDLIYYYWNVLDDREKTEFYIKVGMELCKKNIAIYEDLLLEIKEYSDVNNNIP